MCSYPGNSSGLNTGFLLLPPATAHPQLDAFTSACHASSALLVPAAALSPLVYLVEGMWLIAHLKPLSRWYSCAQARGHPLCYV